MWPHYVWLVLLTEWIGVTFTEPSWYSRECNYYQKLTTGINDQSFVLSLQLASTSLCYMQLVSNPY